MADQGDYFGAQETSLEATKYFKEKNNKQDYYYIDSNYNNLGIICLNLKDYKKAIEFYNKAIKFSNKKEDVQMYLNNKAKTFQETKKL